MRPGELVPFVPEIVLTAAALAVLLLALPFGRRRLRPLARFAVASLAVTAAAVWLLGRPAGDPQAILGNMLVVDQMAVYFKLLTLAASAIAVVMAVGYLERSAYGGGELLVLMLLATVGMMVMSSGASLASLYVGLELTAVSVYVMVGYFKLEARSVEGAVKCFVLGALSSAILLYGISLVYGVLGTLEVAAIRAALEGAPQDNILLMMGIVLVAFGMLFKVAAVPFHVWTPDAYEGAPTPVTAFMSVGPTAAAFAMFLRLFAGAFEPQVDHWRTVLWMAAAATMVWGNVAALTQDNVKRMLAYSSVAHAGYALLGLVAATPMGSWSVLVYMLVYTFMNLGAFGIVILLESRGYAGATVTDYAGLARRHPATAAFMLIFMLALAGIPPTAGFMGKLCLFAAAVEAGYVGLVVIAVLMSAVSLFYYVRIVVQMYLRDGEEAERDSAEMLRDRWVETMVAVCAAVTLVVGVWPAPVVAWAQSGVNALGL